MQAEVKAVIQLCAVCCKNQPASVHPACSKSHRLCSSKTREDHGRLCSLSSLRLSPGLTVPCNVKDLELFFLHLSLHEITCPFMAANITQSEP